MVTLLFSRYAVSCYHYYYIRFSVKNPILLFFNVISYYVSVHINIIIFLIILMIYI